MISTSPNWNQISIQNSKCFFQNQKRATVSGSTIIRRCNLKCYPGNQTFCFKVGLTGRVLEVYFLCLFLLHMVHRTCTCMHFMYAWFFFYYNYYYYLHVGIRSIAVGLSVYCSDSGPGCEQTKELQKKMKS